MKIREIEIDNNYPKTSAPILKKGKVRSPPGALEINIIHFYPHS